MENDENKPNFEFSKAMLGSRYSLMKAEDIGAHYVVMISRLLKRHRQKAGMSQSELARRSGLNRSAINRLEQEHGYDSAPNTSTIQAYANALGVIINIPFYPRGMGYELKEKKEQTNKTK